MSFNRSSQRSQQPPGTPSQQVNPTSRHGMLSERVSGPRRGSGDSRDAFQVQSQAPSRQRPSAPTGNAPAGSTAEQVALGLRYPVEVYRPPEGYFDQNHFPHNTHASLKPTDPNCFFCGEIKSSHDHLTCTRTCMVCREPGHGGRICPLLWVTNSWLNHKGFTATAIRSLENIRPSEREAQKLAEAGYLTFTKREGDLIGHMLVWITWLRPPVRPMEDPVARLKSQPINWSEHMRRAAAKDTHPSKKRSAPVDQDALSESRPTTSRRKVDDSRWVAGRNDDPLPAILEHIGLPHLLAVFQGHDVNTWAVASSLEKSDMKEMGISIGNQVQFFQEVKRNPNGEFPPSGQSQSHQRLDPSPGTQSSPRFTASRAQHGAHLSPDSRRRDANPSHGYRDRAPRRPAQGTRSFHPPPAPFASHASERNVPRRLKAEERTKSEPRDGTEPCIKPEPLD